MLGERVTCIHTGPPELHVTWLRLTEAEETTEEQQNLQDLMILWF